MLKCVACKNCLSSVATLTTEFQTASGSNLSTRTVLWELHDMTWVFMGKQPHTSLRSLCIMPNVGESGVKLAAIELWSSRNAFSGGMNQASPSGSPTNKSGFGRSQENTTCPNA
jgi:hypothetical protein